MQSEEARKQINATLPQEQRRRKSLWVAAAVLGLGLASAPAQPAITECMSWAAVTPVGTNSDWWELTHFGSEPTNLTGWFWTDNSRSPDPSSWRAFQGLVVNPGQSVVFFRVRETPTVQKFREWWGGCLGADVPVGSWDRPGFDNSVGDEIWLYDAHSNLVDQVSFGAARAGVTFTYDTDTGDFGVYSVLGRCGTCRATTGDDIGSPGTSCGPVPLRIVQQPVSIEVDAGSEATLAVLAVGLPRPRYQWFLGTNPVPGASSSHFTIPEALPTDAGEYTVVVSNGLDRMVSASALLTVATNLRCPELCFVLDDVERFEGETAVFEVCVRAYPRARFQWQSNGVDIVGATNRGLTLPGVRLDASGTTYRVKIWNVCGSTNASARLWVQPWPKLDITEAFPAASLSTNYLGPRPNWWELTNRGTNAVKLRGMRHGDRPSFYGGRIITNNAVLQPGESVIFADSPTREDFVRWWGETNLPPRMQVIPFGGFGLSAWSDAIHLWSVAGSLLASVSYASPTPYPFLPPTIYCDSPCPSSLCDVPIYGHSLWFDSTNECAWGGQGSEENVDGAFRAAASDDVGSPGFFVLPRFYGFERNESTLTLRWRAVKGKRYQVEWRPEVEAGVWSTEGVTQTAQGSTLTATATVPPGTARRFYRLRELP